MSTESFSKNLKILTACGLILCCFYVLAAQTYTGSPVTKDRLVRTIQSRQYAVPKIVATIRKHGVNFALTDDIERELEAIRTNRLIIEAVGNNYRNARTSASRGTTGAANTARNSGRGGTTSLANTVASSGGGESDGYSGEDQGSAEEYEKLFYQGVQMGNQLRTATSPQQVASIAQSVKSTGERAIKLDPARPEAYTLVGASLMMTGNFNEAERYGQAAIDRGGSLAFSVYHMSGTPHPETLFVAKGYITVESNQKYFHFTGSQVLGTQQQGFYNLPNGGSVPVFSVTTSKDGRTDRWDFAPGMTGTAQEAAMIMRLIQKNV